ncbi:MAG: S8 family serine peptidase [bacterium]
MKQVLFTIILFVFVICYSEQYVLEFDGSVDNMKHPSIKRIIKRYNYVVVDMAREDIESAFPDVKSVYPDPKVKAAYKPSDPYIDYQWNLLAEHYNISGMLDRGVTGSRSVIIGILDTGIAFEDYTIPSSESDRVYSSDGQYHQYSDFTDINFSNGYDFVSDDLHANDMNGHGTNCCAIIAAGVDNNIDMSGIVSQASVMPLRVLDENGEGNSSDIVSAVEHAINYGCNVLNLSLAGESNDSLGWHPLHVAIIDAVANGITVVCATGNNGASYISYPAKFEEAVAVGGVDYHFDRAPYSQYGEGLDFSAPGGVVYQDNDNDGNYDGGILIPSFDTYNSQTDVSSFSIYYGEGTSFAAPHITALAALLYSIGYSGSDEIEDALIEGCLDLGAAGYDQEFGWGYPHPDSLFSRKVKLTVIEYDYMRNSFDIALSPIETGVVIDSMIFEGRSFRDVHSVNASSYTAGFTGLNTGVYTLGIYLTGSEGHESMETDILLKSPSDTTSYIYNGNTSFYLQSGGFILMEGNKFNVKGLDSTGELVFTTDSPGHYTVMRNSREIQCRRNEKALFAEISRNGIYRIVERRDKKYNVEKKSESGTILLSSQNTVKWDNSPYALFDRTGRSIKSGSGFTVSFAGMNPGIYFISSGGRVWKIIKLH